MKCRSEWQRPATDVRISTSRGPGFGTLTSSITKGLLTSISRAAFIASSLNFLIVFLTRKQSLLRQQQFANLLHSHSAIVQQTACDRIIGPIFRNPEQIRWRKPMFDHEPGEQQPARIAAHLVDALGFPRQGDSAGDMIEQAGGAP